MVQICMKQGLFQKPATAYGGDKKCYLLRDHKSMGENASADPLKNELGCKFKFSSPL